MFNTTDTALGHNSRRGQLYIIYIFSSGNQHGRRKMLRMEISRKINLTWIAFGKFNNVFHNNDVVINLKNKLYCRCILPILSYRTKTWLFTRGIIKQISKREINDEYQTQRKAEPYFDQTANTTNEHCRTYRHT